MMLIQPTDRRLVLVCDNAWLALGLQQEATYFQEVPEIIILPGLTSSYITQINFSRDVIIYISSHASLAQDMYRLALYYRIKRQHHDRLNIIYAGDNALFPLVQYIFQWLNVPHLPDICLRDTDYQTLCFRTLCDLAKNTSRLSSGGYNQNVSFLTAAEYQILLLIAADHSIRAIAEMLQLSEKTIYCHRSNIARKFRSQDFIRFYNQFRTSKDAFFHITQQPPGALALAA